jgi:hypothetical protein
MPSEQVRLRIVLVAPPAGVPWALQVGRHELVAPVLVARDRVVLEATATLGPARPDGARPFRGPAVQGPPAARFIYATSGKRAGDADSPWDRRAKVPLPPLPAEVVAAWQRAPDSVLEARVAGAGRDGSPACASVPLLDGGWRLVRPADDVAPVRSDEAGR